MDKFTIILTVYLLPTLLYATDVDLNEQLPIFKNPSCDNESITIDFSNSAITKIGKNFIKSPQVTCLKIVSNRVEEIQRGAFDLLPNLKILDLQENWLAPEIFFAFGGHLNLTSINLASQTLNSHYPIRVIIKDVYPKLMSLNLSRNSIIQLDLEGNRDNVFPSLMHLDLSNNKLSTFNNIQLIPSSLLVLYLNDNELTSFDMSHLSNLEILNLENNQLYQLIRIENFYYYSHTVSLRNLYNLRYLSLAHNKMSSIQSEVFNDCTLLETLKLSHNEIDDIQMIIFDRLKNLKHLHLNNNKLTDIPEIRGTLGSMAILDLAHNRIKSVITGSFSHLPNLTTLSLANNEITLVDPTAFANLMKLEYLNLSKNRLESLPDMWCASLTSLKQLHLSDNYFTMLEHLSLDSDLPLMDLYLHNNALTTLKADSFADLPTNVTVHINNTSPQPCHSVDLYLERY